MRARIEQYEEDFLFRAYLTEALNAYGQGKCLQARWVDMVAKDEKTDSRSVDEFAANFIQQAGLKQKGGEERGSDELGGAADA